MSAHILDLPPARHLEGHRAKTSQFKSAVFTPKAVGSDDPEGSRSRSVTVPQRRALARDSVSTSERALT